MNTVNSDRDPALKEDDPKWGLIILLMMVLGIPFVAIVMKVLSQ
jgi:hypothetical protein